MKYIIITTIATLILIFVVFVLVVHNYTKTNEDCRVANHNLRTVLNLVEIQENTKHLSLKDISAKDENNTSGTFQELFSQPKFLIRIANVGCLSCINSFIENLPIVNQLIDSIGVKNACFILPDLLPREILKFKNDNNIQADVIRIPAGEIPVPMESTEYIIPCYFLLIDNENTIIDCFIPISDIPNMQSIFLSSIIRFFKTFPK